MRKQGGKTRRPSSIKWGSKPVRRFACLYRIPKQKKLRNRGQYSSNRIQSPEKSACRKGGNRGHERHGLGESWRDEWKASSSSKRRTAVARVFGWLKAYLCQKTGIISLNRSKTGENRALLFTHWVMGIFYKALILNALILVWQ